MFRFLFVRVLRPLAEFHKFLPDNRSHRLDKDHRLFPGEPVFCNLHILQDRHIRYHGIFFPVGWQHCHPVFHESVYPAVNLLPRHFHRSVVIFWGVVSAIGPLDTNFPFQKTVYLSAISNISGILWDIKIKDVPSLFD